MTIDLDITNAVEILRTPRVQQLEGMFDVPPAQRSDRTWHHSLSLPDTWNIGVIVGPSGSGKTTLARHAFGDSLIERWDWPEDKSILDGFPAALGIRDITALLCSVGFSSPPSWVRPFAALSNGEQFRVNLARTLGEMPELAVVDEFTSVVDRTAARIGSAAVAKAVRSRNQKFVAVTCHYDILDWLEPDWVYEPHTGKLETAAVAQSEQSRAVSARSIAAGDSSPRGSLRQRPPIDLEIIRVYPSAWQLFKPHHYLSGKLHPAAKCFVALASLDSEPPQPAAFVAALPFPHPRRPGWREHRCVCLPDFQGVGIGNAISEFVAALFTSQGHRYTSTTSHPAMIRHRARSAKWKLLRRPTLGHRQLQGRWIGSVDRLTAGFEYVGEGKR